jgi:GTP-binding protein
MSAESERDPLVIRDLRFLGPMATSDGWRPETTLPQIAFAGRSNVGKSSLLNKLIRRKAFARVSNTPGRTREINFFEVNGRMVFVDLPGYGYARISKARRAEWRPLIEGYLRHSSNLRGVVQLIDVRRDPGEEDFQLLEFLSDLGTPTIVAITKVDKLSSAAAAQRIADLTEALGLDDDQVIPFSAITGRGRDELASAIVSLTDDSPLAGSSVNGEAETDDSTSPEPVQAAEVERPRSPS